MWPVSGNLLDNDDPGDEPATVTAADATSANGGTVTVDIGGNYTYTPPAGFTGEDSFGYTITDANGDVSAATVVITIGMEDIDLELDKSAMFACNPLDDDDFDDDGIPNWADNDDDNDGIRDGRDKDDDNDGILDKYARS